MSGFIAVHVGAGFHGPRRRFSYMKACNDACVMACQMLNDGCKAVDIVTAAVSVLENCPLTNAGIGSNLTQKGDVECDAGIMDGATLDFGSVGSLCSIKNPIQVAKKVLDEQKQGLLKLGLMPPCTLTGKGALDWALSHGFNSICDEELKTEGTIDAYHKYSNLIRKVNQRDNLIPSLNEHPLDTVGAICIDADGNVSSGCSSGGLIMKTPGRIGQSSVYGSGCWAENSTDPEKPSVACNVTGVGEYITKTLLAKEWCQVMHEDDISALALPEVFRKQFFQSPYLRNSKGSKLAGLLSVKYYAADNVCDFAWVHNTQTMALGYMSTSMKKPISLVSLQPIGKRSETIIMGRETRIKWKP